MKKISSAVSSESASARIGSKASRNGPFFSKKGKFLNEYQVSDIFEEIQDKLDQGLSSIAEAKINETLETYSLTPSNQAVLHKFLAYALEMKGDYAEALSLLRAYEDEDILMELDDEAASVVLTQLAIAFSNSGDYPKAVALLKSILEDIPQNQPSDLLGSIYNAFARVYRKLSEIPIARDYAQKALKTYREVGNWRGMSEANGYIGVFYLSEGALEKSAEYLQQSIKIIGDRYAPFILGRAYSELSGTYWFMRRPKDGIECLEKSILFFERTEHRVHAAMGYNNLGINLMQIGEWDRAEQMILKALSITEETKHTNESGIMDSLGELLLLRGDPDAAKIRFEKAIAIARERKALWYEVQATQNLARSLMAKGEYGEAIRTAEDAIAAAEKIGSKHFRDLARLTITESYLKTKRIAECLTELDAFERDESLSDLYVLGSLQRIRGNLCLLSDDRELAIHHFSRSLTLFETAEDLYNIGHANLELGRLMEGIENERSIRHLTSAADIFRKLGIGHLHSAAQGLLEGAGKAEAPKKRTVSAASQLITLRLAEATSSRDLLFRELLSILRQESRARKIAIIQANSEKRQVPFAFDGFTPAEAAEISSRLQMAGNQEKIDQLAREKNLSIFTLRAPSALPAFLILYPKMQSLNDGTSIQMLLRVVELGMDVCALREKDKALRSNAEESILTSSNLLPGFIHSSPAMTELVEEVHKIRTSDVTVLVTGESGTGKEVVSRAIHTLSHRKDKVFVPFNCTAVPKELAEGHLFGYRKGAFTGATQDSPGVIRSADGGTLFLDEIGDLPLDVQPKLLRFLQEGEIQPLGEKKPIKVNVRVIAATNVGLEQNVAEGKFREDLYYRLNVIRLRVPPLRERRSEIPAMVNYYVNHYSEKFNKRNIAVSAQTMDLLMVCEWAGNVRELCNEIQRFVVRSNDGDQIKPDDLSPELMRRAAPIAFADSGVSQPDYNQAPSTIEITSGTLEEAVSELEKRMISESMRQHNGNISRVARELGLTRRGLYLKLERYGLQKAG